MSDDFKTQKISLKLLNAFIIYYRVQTNVQGYNVRIVIQIPQRYGDEIIRVSLFAMLVVSTSNYIV